MKKAIIYSILSVIVMILLTLSWGGVRFVFGVISVFTLFQLFIGNFKDKSTFIGYWLYVILLTLSLVIFIPREYFTFNVMLTSLTSFGEKRGLPFSSEGIMIL